MRFFILRKYSFILPLALLPAYECFAENVNIQCEADFSAMGGSKIRVQLAEQEQGYFVASIDGKETNAKLIATEYVISPKLNWKPDPYSAEFKKLNQGEVALIHIDQLVNLSEKVLAVKAPFPLESVKRMRLFDLTGRPNKFGGTMLMEAYGEKDVLLGRAVRSVFVSACLPID